MKQPDSVDIGTRMDVAKHRLDVAQEDLDTAHLTFDAGQFRGANNRAYYSIFPEEIRHASDYDTFYIASKEVTEQQIKLRKCCWN